MNTDQWIAADKEHCWHPFTVQSDWVESDPLVLVSAEGVWLYDSEGRKYIDGNASIWTNIHGHNHPRINQAISDQLEKVAHTSYLGFANPRASELGQRLCGFFSESGLQRVFFSDDGSTAVECALKMALQYRLQTGEPERTSFIAFDQAYHGDTLGAASLGGVGGFFKAFQKFGVPVKHLSDSGSLNDLEASEIKQIAAVIIEPVIQGVNQMKPWPDGMLTEIRHWCDEHDVHLIFDEVMTGFGRTGTMFACQQEEIVPDYLCLAKGLTGGYLPLAATMVQESIYDAFLGEPDKAFYYGHSYTANQLGCAAALASLDLFAEEQTLNNLPKKIESLAHSLQRIRKKYSLVYDVRQCGLIAGVELREVDGRPFVDTHVGYEVCLLAREYGLLTRPIQNTIVIMPPLSISHDEIQEMCNALGYALSDWLEERKSIT